MFAGKRIGFIGGGAIAEALIRGVVNAGLLTAGQITVGDVAAERLAYLSEKYGVATSLDTAAVAAQASPGRRGRRRSETTAAAALCRSLVLGGQRPHRWLDPTIHACRITRRRTVDPGVRTSECVSKAAAQPNWRQPEAWLTSPCLAWPLAFCHATAAG